MRLMTRAEIDQAWNMTTDERLALGAVEVVRGAVVNRYFYTEADTLGRREYIDYGHIDGKGQGFFCVPFDLPGGLA